MFRIPGQNVQSVVPAKPPPTPMEHGLAALLLSPPVQSIDFRFGHINVMPSGYRAVAQALIDRRVTIDVNPEELNAIKLPGGPPDGMYVVTENRIVVPRHNMFDDPEDIVTLFHEATHVVQDRMKQVISAVQDEGAAQVAEVWFLKEMGFSLATKHEMVLEVGEAMHARRQGKPVVASQTEIYRMNHVVRQVGGIPDVALVMDGF
ncbi:MAG: hypothetical protein AAGB18_05800 [Pseudomonadota bacterium]